MGRGRAKAKQTKVARELKYRNHGADLGALEREMHSGEGWSPAAKVHDDDEDDEGDDPYASWRDDDSESRAG